MKINYLALLLCINYCFAAQQTQTFNRIVPASQVARQRPINVTVHTTNAPKFDPKIILANPNDPTMCISDIGTPIFNCMECLSNENFMKNLLLFNEQQTLYYWLNLDIDDYIIALNHFENENVWQYYYNHLSPRLQKRFPKTLHAQYFIIKVAYMYGYYGTKMLFKSQKKIAHQASDISDLNDLIIKFKNNPSLQDFETRNIHFNKNRNHIFGTVQVNAFSK